MTRRLTNQDAFDGAMLHLLIQGHSCVTTSGQARYRGPRGKSAIGALIPDALYVTAFEGRKVHHLLAAKGPEYDALRERLGGVTPALLDDLQDLHDRSGPSMPNLYRHLALAGAQRIAQSYRLSMRLAKRCATYQHIRGPQMFSAADIRAARAAAPAVDVTPTHLLAPAPDVAADPVPAAAVVLAEAPAGAATPDLAPTPERVPTPELAPAAVLDTAPLAAAAPVQAKAPEPAPQPVKFVEQKQTQGDLDLIARGIAKAIAEATARRIDQPGRR